MFISVLELFKIGIGPSSSHTIGPMVAAKNFIGLAGKYLRSQPHDPDNHVRCTLKGSLAYTGKGHNTDRAITLGLHGYTAAGLAGEDVDALVERIWSQGFVDAGDGISIRFSPGEHITFDRGETLPQHPNGMIFELVGPAGEILLTETYFSIGGGFISTLAEISLVPCNNYNFG